MASIVDPPPDDNPEARDDWSDAPHTVENARFSYRGRHHYQVSIKTDAHRVTISVSPQGRSVRVWLDGVLMQEEPAEVARCIERAVTQ